MKKKELEMSNVIKKIIYVIIAVLLLLAVNFGGRYLFDRGRNKGNQTGAAADVSGYDAAAERIENATGQSEMLLERSARLQERLDSALMMLETSQASLAASETELTALLTELAGLRTEYSLLWESLMKQKNVTRTWKCIAAAGWISTVLTIAISVILGGGK